MPGLVWRLKDGRSVYLLRPRQLDAIPVGTILYSILGQEVIVGRDKIDMNTRGGYIAYGPIYEAGVTEKMTTVTATEWLDKETLYRFSIEEKTPAPDVMRQLQAAKWRAVEGSKKTSLQKLAMPPQITKDLSPLPVAQALLASLKLTVETPTGTHRCVLYRNGVGIAHFDPDAAGEEKRTLQQPKRETVKEPARGPEKSKVPVSAATTPPHTESHPEKTMKIRLPRTAIPAVRLPRLSFKPHQLALAFPILVNLILLAPQLQPVEPYNDSNLHVSMIQWAATQFLHGHIPLDGWFPNFDLGSAQFSRYQSLPHIITAFLIQPFVSTGNTYGPALMAYLLDLYVLLAFWPLCVYWSMRLFDRSRSEAAIAALFAPFLASLIGVSLNGFRLDDYGFEARSYVWQGHGLWTQLWGMWLLPIALGLSWRAIEGRTRPLWAALAIAATVACHFVAGYLALLGLIVFVVARVGSGGQLRARVMRGLIIGIAALAISSWVWVPLWSDSAYGPSLQFFKPELDATAGVVQTLGWLFTGQLFDSQHFPAISILAALGAIFIIWQWKRDPSARAIALFGLLSLLLLSGPQSFPVLNLLPGSADVLFHRFLIGVQLGGLFLAGIGGNWLLQLARKRLPSLRFWKPAYEMPSLAVAAALLLLFPFWSFAGSTAGALIDFEMTGTNSGAAYINAQVQWDNSAAEYDVISLINAAQQNGPGRIYAGRSYPWGKAFLVGYVPAFSMLTTHGADQIGYYEARSLSIDAEANFNAYEIGQYRALNVRYLLLPPLMSPPVPANILASNATGQMYEVAGANHGYVSVVDTVGPPIYADRTNLGTAASDFMNSADLASGYYHPVAYNGNPPADSSLSAGLATGSAGNNASETDDLQDGYVSAQINANRRAVALLSATFDPRWTATVDGQPVPTQMVAPSLVGVPVAEGAHTVVFRYQSYPWYWLMFLLGIGAVALMIRPSLLTRFAIGPLPFRASPQLFKSIQSNEIKHLARSATGRLPRMPPVFKRVPGKWPVLLFALILAAGTAPALQMDVTKSGNDINFMIALQMAVAQHLAWGQQIVWSYGPLGYLDFPVLADGALWSASVIAAVLVDWIFIAALIWFLRSIHASWPWWVVVGLVTYLGTEAYYPPGPEFYFPLHTFLVLTAFLLAARVLIEPGARGTVPALVGIICGVLPLIVLSTASIAVMLPGCFLMAGLTRRQRSLLWAPVSAVVTFVVLWFGLSQPLSAIPGFLITGYSLIEGYLGVMGIVWIDFPLTTQIATVLALGLLIPAALMLIRRIRWSPWPLILATGVMFWAFKEGFVRKDAEHFFQFVALAPIVAILTAATLRFQSTRTPSRSITRHAFLFPAVSAAAASVYFLVVILGVSTASLTAGLTRFLQYPSALGLVFDDTQRNAAIQTNREQLQSWYSIPDLTLGKIGSSTVSIWPVDTAAVFAYSLNWNPTPVLNSYAGYTPILDQLDAQMLSGPNAPEYILWRPWDLDGQASFDYEPAAMRALLNNYQPDGPPASNGGIDWLLLKHSPNVTPAENEISHTTAPVDGWVGVPTVGPHQLLYVSITLQRTPWERLTQFALRGSPIICDIQYAGGYSDSFRLTPDNAQDGVLIGPLPRSSAQLYAVFQGRTFFAPTAIRVHADRGVLEPEISFDFFYTDQVPAS